MPGVLTKSAISSILNWLKDAVGGEGLLDGAKVALFKDSFEEDSELVLDDLVECDFAGYARSAALTWLTPYIDQSTGFLRLEANSVHFACTADPDPEQLIYGIGIIDDTAPDPVLVKIEKIDPPLNVVDEFGLTVVPFVGFDFADALEDTMAVQT